MQIKDVEELAELSRLELSEEEKKFLVGDFDSIIGYIQSIEKAEIGDIEPSYDLKNIWREDVLEERDFSKDLITGQFPEKQSARPDDSSGGDGVFLKVKKIL